LVGLGHEGAGFVDGALGVVIGLDGEAVLVDGALALAGDVEYFAEVDVAPDFDPFGVSIAAEGVAEAVGGGLVVALDHEDFCEAVVGEGAAAVVGEGFLVLGDGGYEVALGYGLLTAEDSDADGEVWGGFEEPVVGVEDDVTGASEGGDGVGGLRASEIDAAIFGFTLGFDAELDGHVEEVKILGDLAYGAEALAIAEAEDGVVVVELRGAGAVEPLGEEWGEAELGDVLGGGLDLGGADGFIGVLGSESLEELLEDVVAHLPAEHVEDHGAFFEGHGLELGGKGIETAEGGEWVSVVREGAGLDVGDG